MLEIRLFRHSHGRSTVILYLKSHTHTNRACHYLMALAIRHRFVFLHLSPSPTPPGSLCVRLLCFRHSDFSFSSLCRRFYLHISHIAIRNACSGWLHTLIRPYVSLVEFTSSALLIRVHTHCIFQQNVNCTGVSTERDAHTQRDRCMPALTRRRSLVERVVRHGENAHGQSSNGMAQTSSSMKKKRDKTIVHRLSYNPLPLHRPNRMVVCAESQASAWIRTKYPVCVTHLRYFVA